MQLKLLNQARGGTELAKVHGRSPDERILITLNEKDQPVSDDQKIITELTNYVGTPTRNMATKIKRDLEIELKTKVNKKVQENITWVLKRLGDANPDLKLDIRDFCPALSSEQDDNGTPVTQGGTSS